MPDRGSSLAAAEQLEALVRQTAGGGGGSVEAGSGAAESAGRLDLKKLSEGDPLHLTLFITEMRGLVPQAGAPGSGTRAELLGGVDEAEEQGLTLAGLGLVAKGAGGGVRARACAVMSC